MIETRTLLFLLNTFARRIIKGSIVFFFGLIIFDKLGLDVRSFIIGSWIMAIPLVVVGGSWLTSANFSWLIGLPISRPRLIFLQYVLQTLIFVLAVIALASITLGWDLYHLGLQGTLANLSQSAEKVHSVIKENPPSGWHLTTWATIITFCAWISLQPLLSLRRGKAGLQYHSSNYSQKKQRQILSYGFAIVLVAFLFRYWLNWGFIWFCALNSLAVYIGTQTAVHWLGLSPERKRFRTQIGMSLAGFSILAIVILGQEHLRSGNAEKIANVIFFAGPYTGNADPIKIARALEADISASSIRELGGFYKNLLRIETLLPPSGHPLTFKAAIQNKSSLIALTSAAELFDLNQISFEDLKQYLSAAEKMRKAASANYLVYNLMNRTFTQDQIRDLLGSDSSILNVLAIRWVRFHPSNQLLTLIEDRLNNYSDVNRLNAILTLSFGATDELHLSNYQTASRPKLNIRYKPEECKNFSTRDLKVSADNPLPKINFCLRAIALRKSGGVHQWIDSVGWYTEDELRNREDWLKKTLALKD